MPRLPLGMYLAVVLCTLSLPVLAQDRIYSVTINTVRTSDGQPVRGATISVQGPGLRNPEYGGDRFQLQRHGAVSMNEAGSMTLYMTPGNYRIMLTHPAHKGQTINLQVPPPGQEDQLEDAWEVFMAFKPDVLARSLTVSVRGELPGGGTEAVADANIEYLIDGGGGGATLTERNGIAVVERAFSIGDPVRIVVKKAGYVSQERTIVIGSFQESANNDPTLTNRTTTDDNAAFMLKRGDGQEITGRTFLPVTTSSMRVEATRRDNNQPITGANVQVERIGGAVIVTGVTNAQGLTDYLQIPIPPASQTHATYRARVKASGYSENWSDIPDSMLLPTGSRPFVVYLEPAAVTIQSSSATEEEAAFNRFVQWAKSKRRQFHGDENISGAAGQSSVAWREPQADGRTYLAAVDLILYQHQPNQPHPGERILFFTEGEPVSLGNGPGRFDRSRRSVTWVHGWFTVMVTYYSTDRAVPTPDEGYRLATEVAGVIGGASR